MKKSTKVLMILDGFGISETKEYNGVSMANTPNIDGYFKNYPNTKLNASGLSVGLPEGQMGNSEVGHLNIGAGRVVYQELTRINKEISEEGFFSNEAFLKAIDYAKKNNSAVHLLGLLSDGGVHSHIDHLIALIKLCKDNGVDKVFVHPFLDGRDVPPQSALKFIKSLEESMDSIGCGKIATLAGRYYAMDRDNRWERVEKAYNAITLLSGEVFESAEDAIKSSYDNDVFDEFVAPCVINGGKGIENNDSVIFFNFRPDRAREITRALTERSFDNFNREYLETYFVSMTQYDKTLENLNIAYMPVNLNNTLGEYLSTQGRRQLRIAETEKYAHVTFFFNGGVEAPMNGEDRILVASPKVATYDLQPEMSADELTERVINEINSGIYDFILINYANPDMVGHTGSLSAVIKAIETVDNCVGKVVNKVLENGGSVCITADHGNAEKMLDMDTKAPFTAHTSNQVPFIVIGEGNVPLKEGGKISDIAPTILELMGLAIPGEITGESLIIDN
ncbi:MAG: 2,3-bisphosphoglycerate-independent phosphoglycerate mutase [Clostridium sp.]